MNPDINNLWTAVPCPCGQSHCHSGMIEPFVVSGQGVMEMDVAIHIVELHNAYVVFLREQEAIDIGG